MFTKIKITVEPQDLEELSKDLQDLDIKEITVIQAKHFEPRGGPQRFNRGRAYSGDFLSEVEVELIIDRERVETVVERIRQTQSHRKGENRKITILPLEEMIILGRVDGGDDLFRGVVS